MTGWDIVLALAIVLAVFVGGRLTGYNRGFADGRHVERELRRRRHLPKG